MAVKAKPKKKPAKKTSAKKPVAKQKPLGDWADKPKLARKASDGKWQPTIPKPVGDAAEALMTAKLEAAGVNKVVKDCEATLDAKALDAGLDIVALSDGTYYKIKNTRKIQRVSHKKLVEAGEINGQA